MTIELSTLPKCAVRSVSVEPNAPRVLEAEHAIRIDDASALPVGATVKYTDPELGLLFYGEIVERRKVYRAGEGVVYRCEDAYRHAAKAPATMAAGSGATSVVLVEAGTSVADALALVLAPVEALFPGGIEVLVSGSTPLLEKGGETIEEWLDEILASAPGGVAWVEPNGGSPKLVISDYYSAPEIELIVGAYGVESPGSGDLLLARGEVAETTAPKYLALAIEGAGIYRRHRMECLATNYPSEGSNEFRWYIPENLILTLHRESGEWRDGTRATIRIGGEHGTTVVMDDPPFVQNGGHPYFFVSIPARTETGAFKKVEGWFDYTSWEGPLVVRASGSGGPLEGERREILGEYFVYEDGDQTVDPRSGMGDLAAARHARIGGGADVTGEVAVHVKGFCADLGIGSAVSNFGGMRVRRIVYDIPARDILLELSDIPIREALEESKHRRRGQRMKGTQNWRRTRRRRNPFRQKGPSWECFPGNPPYRRRDDDRGPFRNEAEAKRACGDWWWYCIDPATGQCWFSSQPVAGPAAGKWNNEADCKASCSGSGTAGFVCEDGRCLQVFGEVPGAFPTYEECCAECSGCESGSGGGSGEPGSGSGEEQEVAVTFDCDPPGGAVRAIRISPRGNVVGVECLACEEIEVLTDVECNEDGSLTKTFETIRYVRCPEA